jgi:hypothetical protein
MDKLIERIASLERMFGVLHGDIEKIKNKLSIDQEIQNEIEITRRANIIADEKFNDYLGKGGKKTINKWRVLKVVLEFAAAIILFTMVFRELSNIGKKLDNFGTPVTTRRGEYFELPSDVEIKMWPQDFVRKDTAKRDVETKDNLSND